MFHSLNFFFLMQCLELDKSRCKCKENSYLLLHVRIRHLDMVNCFLVFVGISDYYLLYSHCANIAAEIVSCSFSGCTH